MKMRRNRSLFFVHKTKITFIMWLIAIMVIDKFFFRYEVTFMLFTHLFQIFNNTIIIFLTLSI